MRAHPYWAARALLAYQAHAGGEPTETALTGSLMQLEHMQNLEAIVRFLNDYARASVKAAKGSKRRR